MSIKRFNVDGFEGGLVPNADGAWVFYEDHAAELARWKKRADYAEAYTVELHKNIEILRADRDYELARVEKANALLRAECEASRKAFVHAQRCWIRMADNPGEGLFSGENTEAMLEARAATDEAGALKGVE